MQTTAHEQAPVPSIEPVPTAKPVGTEAVAAVVAAEPPPTAVATLVAAAVSPAAAVELSAGAAAAGAEEAPPVMALPVPVPFWAMAMDWKRAWVLAAVGLMEKVMPLPQWPFCLQ